MRLTPWSKAPESTIPPVGTKELAEAAGQRSARIDPSSRQLLQAEEAHIRNRRALHFRARWPLATGQDEGAGPRAGNLTGLAISGGGMRSAAFALGVLQALAKHDLLKFFDYMSTVSGGGYVGASLTYWLHRDRKLGVGPEDFPYGTQDPSAWRGLADANAAVRRLAFLRMINRSEGTYPPGVKLADRGFAVAEILYACDVRPDGTRKPRRERSDARLIYIKSALLKDLPLPVLGYRAENADFPYEATADQFFDEDRFEAYRELGYVVADRAASSVIAPALRERAGAPLASRPADRPTADAPVQRSGHAA